MLKKIKFIVSKVLLKLLNVDYGDVSKIISYRLSKARGRMGSLLSSGSLGAWRYLLKGHEYLGNIKDTPEYKLLKTKYYKEIENLDPSSPYDEETTHLLRIRDGINEPECLKLQLQPSIVDSYNSQGSFIPLNEMNNYVPQDIASKTMKSTGLKLKLGSIAGWTQVSVPFEPWLHRDHASEMGYKVFVLLEDITKDMGPTRIYSRFSSYLIGFFRRRKHLDFTLYASSPTLGFKPIELVGKEGDCFVVQTVKCFHQEGLLTGDNSRTIVQYYFWAE